MTQTPIDLISMADVARLAGQSRSTVGNWKLRNPDFPPERGRVSGRPLYDRAEVTAWLESTNRLDTRQPEVAAMWQVADQLRGDMPTEEALPLLLVLLGLLSQAPSSEWQRVLSAPPDTLDTVLRATIHSLLPFADEVLPPGELPGPAIARALATLSRLDRSRVAAMADALLEQAAKAQGHRGAEFVAPLSVRKLVVALADPLGTVYNPASGMAQLLVEVAACSTAEPVHLVGQEINPRIWAMGQLNLAMRGIAADVALGDVIAEDRYPELLATRVIAIPPWSQRLPMSDRLQGDPRWVWGEPGPNDGNAAWTQHCLAHLGDGGRAVIVLPSGALFEGGRAGRIRQRIVKAGLLDAVLSLPPGLFSWTNLPCSVLVFAKGRQILEGKPAPTLMIDLAGSAARGGRSPGLDDGLIQEVVTTYHRWVAGDPPSAEYAAVAAFDDLAANDFIIDPGRYLSLPVAISDPEGLARTRLDLVRQLASLTQASRDADSQLQAALEARR